MLISIEVHAIGELGLGLAAWGLALAALFLKKEKKTLSMLGMGSLACCAASLCLVVFELAHYADIVNSVVHIRESACFSRLCRDNQGCYHNTRLGNNSIG